MHKRKAKKKAKPGGPKVDRRRSTVTDADIVAELARNGGQVMRAAGTLKVREQRVTDVSRKYGGLAEVKKRENSLVAAEQAFITLCGVMETFRRGDGDDVKAFAIGVGVTADKLILLANRGIIRTHHTEESTKREVNVNDLLDRLSRAEIETLLTIRDKANGIEPPEELSDLDNPEIYSDDDPELNQPPPGTRQ